jgi:hypothetical protein
VGPRTELTPLHEAIAPLTRVRELVQVEAPFCAALLAHDLAAVEDYLRTWHLLLQDYEREDERRIAAMPLEEEDDGG